MVGCRKEGGEGGRKGIGKKQKPSKKPSEREEEGRKALQLCLTIAISKFDEHSNGDDV